MGGGERGDFIDEKLLRDFSLDQISRGVIWGREKMRFQSVYGKNILLPTAYSRGPLINYGVGLATMGVNIFWTPPRGSNVFDPSLEE